MEHQSFSCESRLSYAEVLAEDRRVAKRERERMGEKAGKHQSSLDDARDWNDHIFPV